MDAFNDFGKETADSLQPRCGEGEGREYQCGHGDLDGGNVQTHIGWYYSVITNTYRIAALLTAHVENSVDSTRKNRLSAGGRWLAAFGPILAWQGRLV